MRRRFQLTKFVGGGRDRQDIDDEMLGKPEVICLLPMTPVISFGVDYGRAGAAVLPLEKPRIETERYRLQKITCGPNVQLVAHVAEDITDPVAVAEAVTTAAFDLNLWIVER